MLRRICNFDWWGGFWLISLLLGGVVVQVLGHYRLIQVNQGWFVVLWVSTGFLTIGIVLSTCETLFDNRKQIIDYIIERLQTLK
jgi:hypothetical protein